MVLICGAGVNAAAVGPSGRTARLAALGPISGDRGGGRDLGMGALGAAVRARDGRGPRTAFEQLVPAHFGLTRPDAVTRAIYDGRIPEDRVLELAPVVFTAARGGDAVARDLLDRLADELGTMAIAMIRRVGLVRHAFDVVLAGGVFQNHDDAFLARIGTAVRAVAAEGQAGAAAQPAAGGSRAAGAGPHRLRRLARRGGQAARGVHRHGDAATRLERVGRPYLVVSSMPVPLLV